VPFDQEARVRELERRVADMERYLAENSSPLPSESPTVDQSTVKHVTQCVMLLVLLAVLMVSMVFIMQRAGN
jgi:hypothetical protein